MNDNRFGPNKNSWARFFIYAGERLLAFIAIIYGVLSLFNPPMAECSGTGAIILFIVGIIGMYALLAKQYWWRRHTVFLSMILWLIVAVHTSNPVYIMISLVAAIIYILLERYAHHGQQ